MLEKWQDIQGWGSGKPGNLNKEASLEAFKRYISLVRKRTYLLIYFLDPPAMRFSPTSL